MFPRTACETHSARNYGARLHISTSSTFSVTFFLRTATPCPQGFAEGVCPYGMNCIAETPCSDETFLDWLRDKQASDGSGQALAQPGPAPASVASGPTPPAASNVQNDPSAPPTTTSNDDGGRCSSNADCQAGQFCEQPDVTQGGYCGQCLFSGMGCSVDEVCRPISIDNGCHAPQTPGANKCYKLSDLHRDCEVRLNDIGARCDVEMMACKENKQAQEGGGTSAAAAQAPAPADTGDGWTDAAANGAMAHQNPADNSYFCGSSYSNITKQAWRAWEALPWIFAMTTRAASGWPTARKNTSLPRPLLPTCCEPPTEVVSCRERSLTITSS